jgi:hypothetical protein
VAGDLDALQAISVKTYYDTFAAVNTPENMDAYLQSAYNLPKLRRELADESSEFYFVYADDTLAGYLKINEAPAQVEFHDSKALEIERLYVDKAFLGAWGWDARAGATDPSLADASVKMVMAASASMRFLLADSSKYGHAYLARYAHLEDFGVIVTDSDLEGDARAAVRFRCPNLMVAPIERG